MEDILKFINRFNKFGKEVVNCFKERNCYYFYIILKEKYKNAEAYYDLENCHVVTKINGTFYDINGIYKSNSTTIIKYNEINNKLRSQLE